MMMSYISADALDVFSDLAGVVVRLEPFAVGYDERGRFFHAEFARRRRVLFGVYHAVLHARLVQHHFAGLAVGAAAPGKQHRAADRRGRGGACRAVRVQRVRFFEGRVRNVVHLSVLEFLRFAVVPVLHGAVVARDAAVNFGLCAAVRAGELFAREVAVLLADGIGGRKGVVGEFIVVRDLFHESGGRFPVGQLFAEEGVEHRARGVKGLQIVLNVQSVEHVLGISHGQVRAVGVIGRAVFVGGDDVGVLFFVVLGEAVRGGFRRRRFEVEEVAVLFLIVRKPLPHMVEHAFGEFLRLFVRHVLSDPARVERRFVHAHEAYRGEVVGERAEVALRVGVQPLVQKFGDDGALGVERTRGNVHQPVEAAHEILFALRKVSDARHVDGHDAHRTRRFAAAEVPARLFAQFSQVEAQTAAHAADVARLHVRIDVVGKIRRAVLRGHLKEEPVVFGVRPIEIFGDGIGGYGVLESSAVRVALYHDFDERLVHHVHLFLAVFVFEVLVLAAHDGGEFGKVVGHHPVEGDVGKRRLRAPAAGGVHAVNEGLDALFDLVVREVVRLYEGREVGIEGGERLRARPFVLHDAEEVDHLVAEGREVLRGGGSDLPGDAAQTFLDELFERPARAVARQHGQIVDMDIRAAVRVGDLFVIDLRKPVIRRDRPAVGEDQPADRIGDGGIFLYPPVGRLYIAVHEFFVVEQGRLHVADLFALFAVEDVAFSHVRIPRFGEDALNAVLNVLHGDFPVLDLGFEVRRHFQREHVDDARVVLFLNGVERLGDRHGDLFDVELGDLSVPFDDLIHFSLSFPRHAVVLSYVGRALL